MRQSSSSKELNSNSTGSPALRRSGRNVVSPNLPRKSERLNKSAPECSSSRRKSVRLGAPASNSGDEPVKGSSMINVKRSKVSIEAGGLDGEVKRRLDARHYRNLFVEQHKKLAAPPLVSIEEPKPSEKPCQSVCHGIDSHKPKDKHQCVDNQRENKVLNGSNDPVKDPDLPNRVGAEVQFEGVITSGGNEASVQNGGCEVPAPKCEASPVKFDSLKRMSLGDFECVPSAPHKKTPSERDDDEIQVSVPEDIPLVTSRENKGSPSHDESDRVDADTESRVNFVQADATSGGSSLHVDVNVDDDEEIIHNTDDLDQCDLVKDSAQTIGYDSAHAFRSGNEADNFFAKSAPSPRKHRFVEYWVPARLSNLQLEQYCSALISNSILLRSSSRSDPVGALRNLLVTLRQTCSHPFLVDPSLSSSLLNDVKETEYLDVGIKASGKLQLLDSMLLEMRKHGLRVLILYESIDGRDGIGDILDDFLRQRYGQDSYERVDGGGFIPSKRQATLNKFNDKEYGRFAFLLETRACLPSINLSSVDAIIIHNSEWNPVNDIRALQRIVIDSQHDPIKVFRLFLHQTVEENAMLLAKHNVTVDNSMYYINQSNKDKLLMNGASDLFDELERFHSVTAPVSSVISSMEISLLQDVVHELIKLLFQNGREILDGLSICLKVQQNGGDHGKYCLVPDELKTPLEEKWPPDFWSELLDGRNPQWKYVSSSNHRNRKRVRYDENTDSPSHNSDDVVKRRRKVVNDKTYIASGIESEKVSASDKDSGCDEHPSKSLHLSSKTSVVDDVCSPSEVHGNKAVKSGNMLEQSKQANDTQKGLFLKLKSEMGKLCEVLNLPEDVKIIAEQFLQFVMENLLETQDVSREPIAKLQAFHFSVCWVAASLRTQNINYQESLALAKQHLKFCCNEDDTDYMYLKMGLFKELFIHRIVNDSANSLARDKPSRIFDTEKLMVKIIKQIKKKSRQRLDILTQKQVKELEQLQKSIDAEMAQLERWYNLETAVMHSVHGHYSSVAASKKIKEIEDQLAMKLEEHRNSKDIRLKSLENKHLSERDKENALTSGWKENIVKEKLEMLRKLPLSNSENSNQKCFSIDQLRVCDGYKNGCLLENQENIKSQPDVLTARAEVGQLGVSEGPHTLPAVVQPEAINNFVGVDSEVSTSTKVLLEHSINVLAGGGQLPCGQVSNTVNLSPDIVVPGSSSVDAVLVTSQQVSPSTGLISGSGSFNTPAADGSLSHSRDTPEKEVDNSSTIGCPLLQADNVVVPTEEGQGELPSSFVMPSNEQSATDNDAGPSASELQQQQQQQQLLLPHVSSSVPNSGRPMLQVQPSQGIGTLQNTDAQNLVMDNNNEHPNPSQSTILPTTAASTPASFPRSREAHVISNFANTSLPDATSALTVSSRVRFVYLDPLQGELERIQKEADNYIKIYEDQKQRLSFECEKEIKEMIAQIRKYYEATSLELDAAFTCKKKELDSYHKKVFMNKKLAEAFRNKCMELKVSAPPGKSQDNMQRQMPRPVPVSGHQNQIVPGASSSIQTSGNSLPSCTSLRPSNLQATLNPLHPGGHTVAAPKTSTRPGNSAGPSRLEAAQTPSSVAAPPRPTAASSIRLPSARLFHIPPSRNPSGTSYTCEAVTPLAVHSSSAMFQSNSSRLPPSLTPTAPTVNLHSVTGIRTTPPHLRARVSQHIPNPTFPSPPPITSSQPQYSDVPLSAPATTNTNVLPSALKVMAALENQLAACQSHRGNTQTPPLTSASATSPVVCLSDDD